MRALLGDLGAALWSWLTCPRAHGDLVIETDALYLRCGRCGYVSPGLVLDTRAVRRAWRFDRQRARFPKRKAS